MTLETTDAESRDAVINATSLLEELGANVEEVSLPLTKHSVELSLVPLLVEPAMNHRGWIR